MFIAEGLLRLANQKPIWSDMVPSNVVTWWRVVWELASVVNHSLVTNPTIRQPGFDLPRRSWSTLNRFRTGQGRCAANLHIWHLAPSDKCPCGEIQTTCHIVEACPLNKTSWWWLTAAPLCWRCCNQMAGRYSDESARKM